MGDARDIRAFDMDIGRVGGLICYEHHMTLLRAPAQLREAAERYEVPLERLEALAQEIARRLESR